jgi:hypothetical protein
MTLPPATEVFIYINSRSGAIGHLRWSNGDPSGADAHFPWPRWGAVWLSSRWTQLWNQ